MNKPEIIAYLKTQCGWSRGVRAIFDKYSLPYEERNIQENPCDYVEMVERSGQALSPCVEINGVMLADVSGDEVEVYMIEQGLVQPSAAPVAVPTGQACADHGAPVELA